jgi:hypothetical protein
LRIRVVPLVVNLEGQSYREGVDITTDAFYQRLAETNALPTTSQPSPGDFASVYRDLAADDPDILSIHMSSGLSGTFNSARTAAETVPEAKVTLVDTKTFPPAPAGRSKRRRAPCWRRLAAEAVLAWSEIQGRPTVLHAEGLEIPDPRRRSRT